MSAFDDDTTPESRGKPQRNLKAIIEFLKEKIKECESEGEEFLERGNQEAANDELVMWQAFQEVLDFIYTPKTKE